MSIGFVAIIGLDEWSLLYSSRNVNRIGFVKQDSLVTLSPEFTVGLQTKFLYLPPTIRLDFRICIRLRRVVCLRLDVCLRLVDRIIQYCEKK